MVDHYVFCDDSSVAVLMTGPESYPIIQVAEPTVSLQAMLFAPLTIPSAIQSTHANQHSVAFW